MYSMYFFYSDKIRTAKDIAIKNIGKLVPIKQIKVPTYVLMYNTMYLLIVNRLIEKYIIIVIEKLVSEKQCKLSN